MTLYHAGRMRRGSPQYFALLRQLVVSDFKLRDQSTFFGFFWSFLNPILMLSVMFFLFSQRFGGEVENYGVYLLVGIIHYTHFSNTTSRGMRSITGMRHLAANTIFPKEIVVMGGVLSDLIEFALALLVGLVIAALAGVDLGWSLLLLPFVVLLQAVVALWVSMFLATIHVFVPDIQHIYAVFLRILLFITPIFYDRGFVGEGVGQWILDLNPLTHLIEFGRTVIVQGEAFSPVVFGGWLAVNLAVLAGTLRVFHHYEPRFAETI